MIERLQDVHNAIADLNFAQRRELHEQGKITERYIEWGLRVLKLENEQAKILWTLAGWLE